jgi:hypothetical protein
MVERLIVFSAKWLGAEAPGSLAVDGKGGKAELIEKVTRWIAASGRNTSQPGEDFDCFPHSRVTDTESRVCSDDRIL